MRLSEPRTRTLALAPSVLEPCDPITRIEAEARTLNPLGGEAGARLDSEAPRPLASAHRLCHVTDR